MKIDPSSVIYISEKILSHPNRSSQNGLNVYLIVLENSLTNTLPLSSCNF